MHANQHYERKTPPIKMYHVLLNRYIHAPFETPKVVVTLYVASRINGRDSKPHPIAHVVIPPLKTVRRNVCEQRNIPPGSQFLWPIRRILLPALDGHVDDPSLVVGAIVHLIFLQHHRERTTARARPLSHVIERPHDAPAIVARSGDAVVGVRVVPPSPRRRRGRGSGDARMLAARRGRWHDRASIDQIHERFHGRSRTLPRR